MKAESAPDDVTLVPEVQARRHLSARPLQLTILAPYGAWAGRGALRVLRVKDGDERTQIVAGYEGYERLS